MLCVCSPFCCYEYSRSFGLCLCGDHIKWCNCETLFLWAFVKDLQKVCKIAENTKFGNIKSGIIPICG